MAETPSHLPKADSELEPRAYSLSAHFHPAINLSKGGYKFATDISEYLEARSVTIEANQWQFTQPLGIGSMQFTVTPIMVQFDISQPQPMPRLDWITNRCKMVLEVFSDTFSPKMVMLSSAKIMGTRQVDGDAREFLAKHVSVLDPQRLTMLKRPIQIFGLRIACPPYKKKIKKGNKTKEEIIPWQVDIKAESWGEDPTKLWLEADAQWPVAAPWNGGKIQEVVAHLSLVSDYLSKDVMEFLHNPVSGETP